MKPMDFLLNFMIPEFSPTGHFLDRIRRAPDAERFPTREAAIREMRKRLMDGGENLDPDTRERLWRLLNAGDLGGFNLTRLLNGLSRVNIDETA